MQFNIDCNHILQNEITCDRFSFMLFKCVVNFYCFVTLIICSVNVGNMFNSLCNMFSCFCRFCIMYVHLQKGKQCSELNSSYLVQAWVAKQNHTENCQMSGAKTLCPTVGFRPLGDSTRTLDKTIEFSLNGNKLRWTHGIR